MRTVRWAAALALTSMVSGAALAQNHEGHEGHDAHAGVQANAPLAGHVRAANARFVNFNDAALKAEGYGPIPCTSGIDGGAMGIHYVNGKYLGEDTPRIDHPQAVLYEPDRFGHMTLVAAEYLTFKGPAQLEGQLFSFTNAPNRFGLAPFYELHVWAWKPNTKGVFTDFNPDVTCAFAK